MAVSVGSATVGTTGVDFGAGSASVGSRTVQLMMSTDFVGTVTIVGRADPSLEWLAVPYRRVDAGRAASDLGFAADPITTSGLFQVPAGFIVGLMVLCTAGSCSYAVTA